MSKYNHIKSIPIESIPKEEIAQAIHEWAEGYDFLEKFLWVCYERGIKTDGCHAGMRSYVGFSYEGEKDNELALLMNAAISQNESQVMISPHGGNPLSGPDWYKTNIVVGAETEYEEDGKAFFDSLTQQLKNNQSDTNIDFSPLLALTKFFSDNLAGLLIRIRHNNNEYSFSLEGYFPDKDKVEELNSLFQGCGLVMYSHPEGERKNWTCTCADIETLSSKIREVADYIISNYSINPPTEVCENNTFNINANIVRNKAIQEGRPEMFDTWLMTEEERLKKIRSERKKTTSK